MITTAKKRKLDPEGMIKVEDFGIDSKVGIGTEWHALAEFHLSAP